MRKNFNSMQMLKSSDDCNKFSKSVSYETLVGGTATIGREYKQTRRLFLSSADKPLTAVGTLTSLLCNSAKVMEKWLQTSRDLKSDNKSEKNGKTEVCADYRFCKTMRFLCKNLMDGLLQISPVLRLVKVPDLIVVGTLTSLLCNSAKVVERLLRHVITRRTLVRRGYLPEQGTHANEESLFASVTCFMRLPRRIQRMLLVMTIPASCREAHKCRFIFNLIRRSHEKFFKKNFRDDSSCFGFAKILAIALLFTIATTAESSAECVGATETTAGTDTITGAHCGICGTNCNWKIDGDTLKVTGGANGEIGHMNAGAKYIDDVYTYFMPWKGLKSEFSKVDISGVENVGHAAFRNFTNITDIKLDDSITKIEAYAFSASQVKTIILPDSLKTLGYRAFSDGYNNTLEEVVLPDTLLPITNDSHFGDNPEQLNNLKIICLGDTQKCQNVLANYVYWDGSKPEGERHIPFSLAGNVIPADYKYCNTTNYFWNGDSCIREPDVTKRKCCSSCKDVGGYCNRIRYTPAEAAPLLHNDNTNEVTITFKK